MGALLRGLRTDRQGSMAIETALVAPVLVLMSVGAFQVSMMVARQSELQSAAAEATAIVLAAEPNTQAELDTIRAVVADSAGLRDDQVTITRAFRCGTDEAYVASSTACSEGEEVSNFLRIVLTDTYTPQWTRLGVGGPVDYSVVRTVQVS